MTHIIAVVAAAPVVSGVRLTPLQRRAPSGGCGTQEPAKCERDSARARELSRKRAQHRRALVAIRLGGAAERTTVKTYYTRVGSKIHRPANLAAARATCQLAALARRSHARRGARPAQNADRMPGWRSAGEGGGEPCNLRSLGSRSTARLPPR